jgi:hypothetical protein
MTAMHATPECDGRLLRFLAPGLLHGLSNSVFAVVGHAHLLGGEQGDPTRERNAILRACQGANGALDVLRYLVENGSGEERQFCQPGVFLPRLCEVLRVPCRERGARIQFQHSSTDSPVLVEAGVLARAVLVVVAEVAEALATGFAGTLRVDLASQDARRALLKVTLDADPAILPFPIDLVAVRSAVAAALQSTGVRIPPPISRREMHVAVPVKAAGAASA